MRNNSANSENSNRGECPKRVRTCRACVLESDQHTLAEPKESASALSEEYPLTVRQAAKYLGVSPQSVYLWVERKQIPHLRVMGRNIRFLKSDLETFRASFKQEMENA